MDHFNGYSAVKEVDVFVPRTFPVVFERVQNNADRRLNASGIAIIYYSCCLKLDPCCSVVGCSLWPGTNINL